MILSPVVFWFPCYRTQILGWRHWAGIWTICYQSLPLSSTLWFRLPPFRVPQCTTILGVFWSVFQILNLSKKGSYLHRIFRPYNNKITDNWEHHQQKNTIPKAALKATFQSLITQHWIREERKKTSSRHLLPQSLRRKPELPARSPAADNIPPARRARGSHASLIPRACRKQEIVKCDVVRAGSAQHCQERTFRKAQHFEKNYQSFFEFHKMLLYIHITKLRDTEAKKQNEGEYFIL